MWEDSDSKPPQENMHKLLSNHGTKIKACHTPTKLSQINRIAQGPEQSARQCHAPGIADWFHMGQSNWYHVTKTNFFSVNFWIWYFISQIYLWDITQKTYIVISTNSQILLFRRRKIEGPTPNSNSRKNYVDHEYPCQENVPAFSTLKTLHFVPESCTLQSSAPYNILKKVFLNAQCEHIPSLISELPVCFILDNI